MKCTDREKKPFKVGVLSVVKHDYLPRAIAAHPRFSLSFVSDDISRPEWTHERNQKFADEFQIPYIKDIAAAIKDNQIDAVAVSPEAERHCELAIIAAEAGLHIVVDKPLSTNTHKCDKLIDAVNENGVSCLIWNRNYSPIGSRTPNDQPIEWLDRQLEAHSDGSDGGVGTEAMGELEVEGIYPLAYIQMLTGGAKVNRVFARTKSHFHQAHFDNNVDDLATVTLEIEGGITGSLSIGRIGAASHPDIGEIKLHIIGTEGSVVISESRPEVSIHYRDQPMAEFKNQRIADQNNYLLAENFARSIDGTEKPILDCIEARNICATVSAAIEGKPVNVDNRKK
jgi:myo-inositol 2-dehydrogenase/D-chiro-inositol 1-dehydrogenase